MVVSTRPVRVKAADTYAARIEEGASSPCAVAGDYEHDHEILSARIEKEIKSDKYHGLMFSLYRLRRCETDII